MDNRRLVEGDITGTLVRLAIPIMATSFVQMAYSMMDMIWLGRLSTEAVAAAGTGGFFTWLGSALFMIPKIGAEVGVAQSYGRDDMKSVKKYASHTIQLAIIIAVLYSIILISLRHPIIGFFNLGDKEVIRMAVDYLSIVSIGMVFYFLNPVYSGILNGSGDSTMPFKINAIGLIINMVLDPLMIMGIGPFPRMEVRGAALATIIAQFVVTLIFIIVNRDNTNLFSNLKLLDIPEGEYVKNIFKLGFPSALQTGLFASIAMIITRILSRWGPIPIGVQNVGSQIESISWMTAGGFSTAISVFIGQNHGAGHWDRIKKGYRKGLMIVGTIGIFATILLIGGARPIFRLFIPGDEEAIRMGILYLKILGLSQFFMTIEIGTQGAFNGIGRTIPPSLVGIVFNAARIPASLLLSSTILGLSGVWWSISVSSILKGLVLFFWYTRVLRQLPSESGCD
ncbi:MAG: MATE family efflux transporter [Tissierellia bacterium]|nr:MATE family efflux transporter [Tissierellia bacterium]